LASPKPTHDPYRILGILRGASHEEVRAAHRRLAKLYHPDGATGDERRFLAVQEAYQLLSDPARRLEWDRRHAPGPVRASDRRGRADSAPPPGSEVPPRRPAAAAARPRRSRGGRRRVWTAERVPWWEDFRPGSERGAEADAGPLTPDDAPNEFDVFDRSSGAAWSMAARRHFRRGMDDLPSRGVWRYRGSQVVTGAEARKVADEEEETP
jgi:curved DNA-binding protein CbpA